MLNVQLFAGGKGSFILVGENTELGWELFALIPGQSQLSRIGPGLPETETRGTGRVITMRWQKGIL